jgi:hypothetical protein
MPRRPLPAAARLFAVVVLALILQPSSALAAREVPVGLANVNDQNLRDSRWLYAIRFVVDRDTTMYRFFSQMKAKGATWDEHTGTKCTTYGAGCYGAGDGGLIEARLVTIKADGTPDLSNVLARETVDPAKRYSETKAAYGISTISLFWYFNMGGVALEGGRPYAMVYRNVHADPAHNFSSANSPTVKASEAGPNGRNNLDPDAPGAIAGLDPREAVAWSTDGGGSWSWGRQVGPYAGSATSDDGTRLPHYAWQASPSSRPQSNQPYTAYWSTCSDCSLIAHSVPRATTLTAAGGYAPVGESVGVVTVKNLRTGETGHTGELGSGIARGPLDKPVALAVGDSYEITHTGTVYRAEADNYLVQIVGLGGGAFPFTTSGNGADLAELFALPHPYYGHGDVSAGQREQPLGRVKRAVFVRHARLLKPRPLGARRVIRRLRVRGEVKGAAHGRRVAIRVRRRGHWRTVGAARVRRGGHFRLRVPVAMRKRARAVRLRAVTSGVGRSRAVRVRAMR